MLPPYCPSHRATVPGHSGAAASSYLAFQRQKYRSACLIVQLHVKTTHQLVAACSNRQKCMGLLQGPKCRQYQCIKYSQAWIINASHGHEQHVLSVPPWPTLSLCITRAPLPALCNPCASTARLTEAPGMHNTTTTNKQPKQNQTDWQAAHKPGLAVTLRSRDICTAAGMRHGLSMSSYQAEQFQKTPKAAFKRPRCCCW
jgi:hypothetical protein